MKNATTTINPTAAENAKLAKAVEYAKLTKREKFEILADIVKASDSEDTKMLIDFIRHEVELIDKKTASRKPTETQKANVKFECTIICILEVANKPLTISEIQAKSSELSAFTPQKMSALLKKLVDSNKVVRTVEKRKAMFSIVKS